jgi:hypothetical protein
VAEQKPVSSQFQPPLRRQTPHPLAVRGTGVLEGVSVADRREVIVARVGVAALAVGEARADRVVVVALNAEDAVIAEQGEDAVRVRPERPEVAQAVDRVNSSPADVVQGRGEGEVIAVDAAEDGDALGHAFPLNSSAAGVLLGALDPLRRLLS